MPELPEVETLARTLRGRVLGDVMVGAEIRWPRTLAEPAPEAFARAIFGRRISAVERRAKFLLLSLDPFTLVFHLRMTGRLLVADGPQAPELAGAHVHLLLPLASGRVLYFHDVRKFGRVWLVGNVAALLGKLGMEPLSPAFTAEALAGLLAGRRGRIKPLLLDPRLVAGLGNIYVDESLWQAEIHPLRRADTLAAGEVARLHAAIRDVLSRAVEHRGTTLRDYRDAYDAPGGHQFALAAYGRAGEPCPRCGLAISRTVVGGRGTHYCPICQADPAHI
jgi:formamidopyrimidine-DNA glycosylase